MPNDQKNSESTYASANMNAGGSSGVIVSDSRSLSFGVILLTLLGVLMLILAGLWFWYTNVLNRPVVVLPEPSRPTAEENQEPESTTAKAQAEAFNVVSTSNELDAIEADVLSTNIDSLDQEIATIENEIKANNPPTSP